MGAADGSSGSCSSVGIATFTEKKISSALLLSSHYFSAERGDLVKHMQQNLKRFSNYGGYCACTEILTSIDLVIHI